MATPVVILSFEAWDIEDFEDGVGELVVYLNDAMFDMADPAGADVWLTKEIDITPYVGLGLNTLLFSNPQTVNAIHWSRIRNIVITANGKTLLSEPTEHVISGMHCVQVEPSQTWSTTFSTAPPLPCFIATAAYGSPLAPQLNVLRSFRNRCLPEKVVKGYYRVSPSIANFISKHLNMRRLVRSMLKPLIRLLS